MDNDDYFEETVLSGEEENENESGSDNEVESVEENTDIYDKGDDEQYIPETENMSNIKEDVDEADYDDEDDYGDDEDNEEDNEEDDDNEDASVSYNLSSEMTADNSDDEDEDEDDDDEGNQYLQKFNEEINKKYIQDAHPECLAHNYDEISALSKVIRDNNNNIIDNLHKTIPFLTKYEKTRILGQRAKQLDSGAKAFVKVPEHIIEGYLIAQLELEQKRIPFIIRRPTHGGGCEYWKLQDLEVLV